MPELDQVNPLGYIYPTGKVLCARHGVSYWRASHIGATPIYRDSITDGDLVCDIENCGTILARNSTDAAPSVTYPQRVSVNQTESKRKDKRMPRLDDDELSRMARLKQQVGRYHRNVANSPILCIGIGLIALFFGILCTTVDIATTEYLATGSLDKITGIQWGIWTQPWMLVTGQIPNLTQAVGFVYAWTVETVQLIFGLVLGHALTKVHSVSSRLARGFAVIGTILILLNGVATYNAAPVANPLMQFLIAIAMGGFSIVSFPIGIGLIETGMEEIF